MALSSGRRPQIFHIDQGFPLISEDFVARLQGRGSRSADPGRKRCDDNILIEKLWRTLKYVAAGFSSEPRGNLSTGQ
jgi:putative transposase